MKKKNVVAKVLTKAGASALLLSLVATSMISCGGDKSTGNGNGGPGTSSIFQPSVNPDGSVSYPFTATSYQPISPYGSQSLRFLAGVFPTVNSGNCNMPSGYDAYRNPVFYWCNARQSAWPVNAVFNNVPIFTGIDFGSVTPTLSSFAAQTANNGYSNGYNTNYNGGYSYGTPVVQQGRPVNGYGTYGDGSSVAIMAAPSPSQVACPGHYQQQGYATCVQRTLSGTIRLSAQYIRDNLNNNNQLQRIALDVDLTTGGGIIFLLNSSVPAVITF